MKINGMNILELIDDLMNQGLTEEQAEQEASTMFENEKILNGQINNSYIIKITGGIEK